MIYLGDNWPDKYRNGAFMCNIHGQCVSHGKRENGYVDYVKGANIAGFLKVANSMLDMGVI